MGESSEEQGTGESLVAVLGSVPDPRSRQGRRHPLGAILGLAVCAMLCGARSLYAIAQWGRDHGPAMADALGFTRHHTPCVSTLHAVFTQLDGQAFEERLGGWLRGRGLRMGEGISMDGKALCGIHGEEIAGVHLVAAFAQQTGIVVDQEAVAGKGHELDGLRSLLERVPLKGLVVTGDALYAQRDVCQSIAEKGGPICSR